MSVIGDPSGMLNSSNLSFYSAISLTTPSDVDPSLDDLDGLCNAVIMYNDSGEEPTQVPIGLSVHTAD